MALQAYADAKSGAMQVYKAPELTIEEIERRQKEVRAFWEPGLHHLASGCARQAEELEEKLRIIDERVPHVPQNLQGTTAGAGSSTFHKYRLVRVVGGWWWQHNAFNMVLLIPRRGGESRSVWSRWKRTGRKSKSRMSTRCAGACKQSRIASPTHLWQQRRKKELHEMDEQRTAKRRAKRQKRKV